MKKAIVIGGGIGGLSIAARLLKDGFNVDLYEKNKSLGGKISQVKFADFKFDLTASLLMIPNDYTEIFSYCNKNYKDYFSFIPLNNLYKVFYYDNTNYTFQTDLPSLCKTINNITNNDLNDMYSYFNFLSTNYKKYLLAEKYFLNNSEKHYFVFTDAQSIYDENCDRVHKIYQKTLGWPYNTLMRFNMFKGIEEFDYIFFLNANMLFVDYVGEEILPKEEGLLVAKHPAFYDKDVDEYPYDRNEKSLAYIPYGQGDVYVQGAFNGGKSRDFLQLINELDKNINIDLDNVFMLKER